MPAAFSVSVPSACTERHEHGKCTRRRALLAGITLAAATTSSAGLDLVFPQQATARGLPPGVAASALPTKFPTSFPYTASDFARYDEEDDTKYYAQPRRVTHIDGRCVNSLREYCARRMRANDRVLDLCAAYASYVPADVHAVGLGMNRLEMVDNESLERVVVQDLNKGDVRIPFDSGAFDWVLCALSIDYLTRPVQVLREAGRVLAPGGKVAVAFSDRVFAEKAVANWTAGSDEDHIYSVACYIHFSEMFGQPQVFDISPRSRNGNLLGDPLYVVEAIRL